MNSQDLIDIGWQLARPCINLHIAHPSEPVIAIWGGDGIVPKPFGPYSHWISLACHTLPPPSASGTGWLSIYSDRKLICSILQAWLGSGMLLMIQVIGSRHAPETLYPKPFAT